MALVADDGAEGPGNVSGDFLGEIVGHDGDDAAIAWSAIAEQRLQLGV